MLKGWIKAFVKRCGYECFGYPRAYASQHTLNGLLRQQKINLVLDVGANAGQFADDLRSSGYAGRILSFEPQSSAHAALCKHAAGDANWSVAERMAVGAETGTVAMNISGNSVSSSILAILPSHTDAAPESSYVRTEDVPVRRLDDVCALSTADRVLLKIDVQGYEKHVLDGATSVLEQCQAVLVEMSLVPLYDGQPLLREVWDMLAAKGFEVWSLEPGFRSPENWRLLQVDGVFFRAGDKLTS